MGLFSSHIDRSVILSIFYHLRRDQITLDIACRDSEAAVHQNSRRCIMHGIAFLLRHQKIGHKISGLCICFLIFSGYICILRIDLFCISDVLI